MTRRSSTSTLYWWRTVRPAVARGVGGNTDPCPLRLTCLGVMVITLTVLVGHRHCQPACGPPLPVLNANATLNANLTQATYTCHEGYLPDSGHPNSTCVDGNWTVPGLQCQAIDCGQPPTIDQAWQIGGNNTVYRSRVYYHCHSGHVWAAANFSIQGNVSVSCSIDDYGQPYWVGDVDLDSVSCKRKKEYKGCFHGNGTMVAEGNISAAACQTHCRTLRKTYSALRADECACADAMLNDVMDDAECSLPCGQTNGQLCGGDDDRWSVYVSFHGCFTNLATSDTFKALNEQSCTELCRGQDQTYAAYSPYRCACYSHIPPNVQAHASPCNNQTNSAGNFTANVSFLGETQAINASTCKELFRQGVFLSGKYYLLGRNDTVVCNFYDNSTTCEAEWIAYNGGCYYFHTREMNFDSAWEFCVDHDSLPVVINTEEESVFLEMVYNSAEEVFGTLPNPFLGMYDAFDVMTHQWLDGSLRTYLYFADEHPTYVGARCVAIDGEMTGLPWISIECDDMGRAICERSIGVYGCIEHGISGGTPIHTLVDTQYMSLSVCMETCRSRGAFYASVSGATCNCLTSLPPHTRVPWGECGSERCTGNLFQLCGNSVADNDSVTAFVIQNVGRPYASSCQDLEAEGIHGDNLTIINDNDALVIMDCATSETNASCPFSFLRMNGRCYKYFPSVSNNPAKKCKDMHTYAVVLNSPEEADLVFGDPQVLQGYNEWAVGLFNYTGPAGLPRTGSGESLHGLVQPANLGGRAKCFVYNTAQKVVKPGSCAMPVVCETGPEFVGCGLTPNSSDALVLDDYSEMSVLQCVELCRARRQRYASLSRMSIFRCYCTSTVPSLRSDLECHTACFSNDAQLCGSKHYSYHVAVYDVDYFEPFANNCSDLFEADVLVPGNYVIGGEPTFCYMKDNSTCSLPSSYWEGVGLNGACFKWSLQYVNTDACRSLSPSHRPASVRSADELQLLHSMLHRMKFFIFWNNVVGLGGVDEFKMGAFTWADGWLMTLSAWKGGFPQLNYSTAANEHPGVIITFNKAGQFENSIIWRRMTVCREASDDLGCFVLNNSMTPVIANYSSMSVTLCKQTCLALNQSLALLDVSSCYCAPDSSFLEATDDIGCDVACPGNHLQGCASRGFLQGYLVDWKDMADKCDVLYANFVLLHNTYLLRDNVTGDVIPTVCGLSDTTACPPGFLGNQGRCFRFFPWTQNAEEAAQLCLSLTGSSLAVPNDLDDITFLVQAIRGIPSLATFEYWRLGVQPSGRDQLAVGSDGSLLTSALWNVTSMPGNHGFVILNAQLSQLERTIAFTDTLPFICQVRPGFRGCRNFSSAFNSLATFDLSQSSRTVQQCVALCHAQDARYALLGSVTCSCVTSDVSTISDVAVCLAEGCGDNSIQACGNDSAGIYAVYDIEAYNNTEKEAESCDHYRSVQVTATAQYYLRLSPTEKMRVTCGTFGVGHDDIVAQEGGSAMYQASSVLSATAQDARLSVETPVRNTWQPLASDTQPWIQVTLANTYAVKALVITGDGTVGGGHVKDLTVSYGMSADDLIDYGSTLFGPSHSRELAVRFFPVPLVAQVVRLRPLTSSGTLSLAFTLLGQLYSAYNDSDYYLGCFADPASSLLESMTTASSAEQCRANCSSQSYPFFGLLQLAGNDMCGCSHAIGTQYGELEVTSCNTTCVASRCGSDVTRSVAMYRAYEMNCGPEPDVINANRSVMSWAGRTDKGLAEIGRTVTWNCPEGHELAGVGGNNVSITCLPNRTWSAIPPPACEVVVCNAPPNVSNAIVTYHNVTYGSEAVYVCEGNLQTEEGPSYKKTKCSHTKEWLPAPPTCELKPFRQRKFCQKRAGHRLAGSLKALEVKSWAVCAVACVNEGACDVYSFRHNPFIGLENSHNCLLHQLTLGMYETVEDSDWDVFLVDEGGYESC